MSTLPLPTLSTMRLTLRPFGEDDAPEVARLAAAREIAATTMLIPHPYELRHAQDWIASHAAAWRAQQMLTLGLTLTGTGELAGCVLLKLEPAHLHAELGYWVGVPFWNRGLASEAGRAAIDYAFGDLRLRGEPVIRVHAHAFGSNPASCRVLEKVGMKLEGVQRRHIIKWGQWQDAVMYGLLREEWAGRG